MATKKKARPRNRTYQIAVYPTPPLLAMISEEAMRRRRKLGPTVVEIVREWFRQREADPKYADI